MIGRILGDGILSLIFQGFCVSFPSITSLSLLRLLLAFFVRMSAEAAKMLIALLLY
jgi:hypothetical protein